MNAQAHDAFEKSRVVMRKVLQLCGLVMARNESDESH